MSLENKLILKGLLSACQSNLYMSCLFCETKITDSDSEEDKNSFKDKKRTLVSTLT